MQTHAKLHIDIMIFHNGEGKVSALASPGRVQRGYVLFDVREPLKPSKDADSVANGSRTIIQG